MPVKFKNSAFYPVNHFYIFEQKPCLKPPEKHSQFMEVFIDSWQ